MEEGLKAIAIDENYSIGYFNVAFALLYLDRVDESDALLQKAAERKVETVEFSLCRYWVAFLRKDQAALETEVTQRKAKLEAHGWFQHQEAMTLAYQGRVKQANRLSAQAVALARQEGLAERAALFAGACAVWNALFGLVAEAKRSAEAALAFCRGRDSDYGPAFALALLHDSALSREIQADLERRHPEDTSVQFSYLPSLRALHALNEGNASKALACTEEAAPYELAVPGTAYFTGVFFGALYPVYVRGVAYSRLSRHEDAAAEFQKILSHPGIMLNDPILPRTCLELARVLLASGSKEKAVTVYENLLSLWRDGDPDAPLVVQARQESARLQ